MNLDKNRNLPDETSFSGRTYLVGFIALLSIIGAVCFFLGSPDPPMEKAPFRLGDQYSVGVVMTNDPDQISRLGDVKGKKIALKIYTDGGKTRLEYVDNGRQEVMIFRPDLQKTWTIDQVLIVKKIAREFPCDLNLLKERIPNLELHGTFKAVGADIVDGAVCTKYKFKPDHNGGHRFIWVDDSTKAPVKMAADDYSFTILWKNYQAGPQAPSLFELPIGYQAKREPPQPN